MVCRSCGSVVDERDSICPVCHQLLNETSAHEEDPLMAYRQGKKGYVPPAAEPEHAGRRRRRAAAYPAEAQTDQSEVFKDAPCVLPSWNQSGDEGEEGAENEAYGQTGSGRGQEAPPHIDRDGIYGKKPHYGYTQEQNAIPVPRYRQDKPYRIRRGNVNWVKFWMIAGAGLVVVLIGIIVFLREVPEGQRLYAKLGGTVPSFVLWEVGEEKLDTGDIDGAVRDFETARQMDGEDHINVDYLLLLAGAYEAAGRIEDAEALYTDIYTTYAPTRPEAYRHMIRLLIASDRKAEAAALMLQAAENTGQDAFARQRSEFIPKPPDANPIAGFYEQVRKLTLISPEGYDVYYSADVDAKLPEEGTLYTEPVILDEGNHDLRAVAVNGELVSDIWKGNYRIIKPSPQQPQTNLAPNTYKQRQRVRLRPGKDNEKDTDITIYYTIDGSIPDADSPIYTGEPIVLPGGRVTLKAVAVNGDNKASNMLEVGYKIEAKPYPLESYTNQDTFAPFALSTTTREEFFAKFGEGQEAGEVKLDRYDTPCQKYSYDWGNVLMYKTAKSWVLVQVSVVTQEYQAPRKTQVGMALNDVIAKFRDMGQLPGRKGHRGLYNNTEGTGELIPQEDGTKLLKYTTDSNSGFRLMLEYLGDQQDLVREIRYTAVPY